MQVAYSVYGLGRQ